MGSVVEWLPKVWLGRGGVAATRVEDYKRKCAADKEQHSVVVRQHRRLVANQATQQASKQAKQPTEVSPCASCESVSYSS